MADRVLIVGGGLAGLAVASALGPRGFRVTLLESRNRLGGRAGSFHDAASDQLVDVCQHVSMGCCTNFDHFCRSVGIAHFLAPQPTLYFMTADRRVSEFTAGRLPAPFHLGGSFLRLHFLTWFEKCRIAWGLLCLRLAGAKADEPFVPWLLRHGQTQRTIERFWAVVLVSALNEEPERIGLRYARKVFVDGFLRHRRGFEVVIPSVPLGRLYGAELQDWLQSHSVTVRPGTGVRKVACDETGVSHVETRDGERIEADWYILTVPFERLPSLLPAHMIERHPFLRDLQQLETSPITSVHLWYDRPVTPLPHVVLVGCAGQWVFNRGEVLPGEHYLQVVVSASRSLRALGAAEIQQRIASELEELFPAAVGALQRSRVVTEHAATFSAVPGVDTLRPAQATSIGNLFLAGDWTATGWPATMEGAVRSGYLAAEAVLRAVGRPEKLVQADLFSHG